MATTTDPFASIGGGVQTANGGWIPKSMQQPQPYASPVEDALLAREGLPAKDPNATGTAYDLANTINPATGRLYGESLQREGVAAPAATAGPDTAAPIVTTSYAPEAQPTAAAPAPNPADPFASIGGGVQTANGGWVPKGHPDAVAAAAPAAGAPAAGAPAAGGNTYTPPNAAPGTPGATNAATQNANAQTYSSTPGAAPSAYTANQGTQDVVRNQYLQTIQKGTNVDTNDPAFRMQADAFSAAQERARRNAQDDSLQSSFANDTLHSGADNVERRMMDESAARNVGQFEAGLVGQELQSRRAEIQQALQGLQGQISGDQQAALTRELAALDAAIKREGLAQTGQLGNKDIDVRQQLGTGALNVDLIRALLGNQNFNDNLGFNVSNAAVQNLLRASGR